MIETFHHFYHEHPAEFLGVCLIALLGVFAFTVVRELGLAVIDRMFSKGKKDE